MITDAQSPIQWRLSRGQQSLWITTQLAPEAAAYNMSLAYEITGDLDPSRLGAALNTIVHRHQVLSSMIDDSTGSVCHTLVEGPEVQLKILTAGGSLAESHEAAVAFVSIPFDLKNELPLRAALFQFEPRRHLFVLCVHHLVADGWSLDLIAEEVAAAYAGNLPTDSGSVRQFAEFAAAEEEAAGIERSAAARAYWLEQLEGVPQIFELPAQHPRPKVKSFSGRTFVDVLPSAIVDELRHFCGIRRHTHSSVLLAGYASLLYRYTGRSDFLLGIPVPGRVAEDSKDTVGLFANLIPLRIRASANLSFAALLEQTWFGTLDALDWQDYPFSSIIRDLKPVRNLATTPVVQNIFNYMRRNRSLCIAGACVERVDLETRHAKYDFALQFIDDGARLKCMLVYDEKLFDEAFVRDFYRDFLILLRTAMSAPQTPLGELLPEQLRVAAAGNA